MNCGSRGSLPVSGPEAPPFRDVRVLELTRGQAGRMAGMLLADLGADAVTGVAGADGLAEAFAARSAEHWLTALAGHDVPACPVIERDLALCDPELGDVGLTHVVRDPQIGRPRVVRTYADRAGGTPDASAGGWQRQVAAVLRSAGSLSEPFAPV
jgi:crotonobetainyl-CoA:carnitine CoA-transferase CaiB-like acyl-CoA transferase